MYGVAALGEVILMEGAVLLGAASANTVTGLEVVGLVLIVSSPLRSGWPRPVRMFASYN